MSLGKDKALEGEHLTEVRKFLLFRKYLQILVVLGYKSCLDKLVNVDEHGISRKSRVALVRGVTEACGAYRKNLPVGLTCFFQKINEFICLAAESSHSVWRREACNVHKNAASSHKFIRPFGYFIQ